MNCEFITKGKKATACMNTVGGVKNLYFAPFGDYGMTKSGMEISNIGTLEEVYKYELTGSGNGLTETYTASMENMTAFISQALNATFAGLDSETQNELQLLLKARTVIFAEDYNGNVKVIGYENGAYGSGGTTVYGAAKGDLNGFTIEFTAEEKDYAPFLSSSAKTALAAAVVNSYID